jgi:hypothetical protein
MQIVVQVHSLHLPYFPFFHKFLAVFLIQTFFYTIMNLFITLLENVNKSRTSANNVSLIVVLSFSSRRAEAEPSHDEAETIVRSV